MITVPKANPPNPLSQVKIPPPPSSTVNPAEATVTQAAQSGTDDASLAMSPTATETPTGRVAGGVEAPLVGHIDASPAAHVHINNRVDALSTNPAGDPATHTENLPLSGIKSPSVLADLPAQYQTGAPPAEAQPLVSPANPVRDIIVDGPAHPPAITFTNPDGVSMQVSSPLPATSAANTPITTPAASPVGLSPALLPATSSASTSQLSLAVPGSLRVPSALDTKTKKLGKRMRPSNSSTPRHVVPR